MKTELNRVTDVFKAISNVLEMYADGDESWVSELEGTKSVVRNWLITYDDAADILTSLEMLGEQLELCDD